MKSRSIIFLIFCLLFSTVFVSCDLQEIVEIGETVTVSFVYDTGKNNWVEPLAASYNSQNHRTEAGNRIVIQTESIGSVEAAKKILSEELKPVVWSPSSSIYVPVVEMKWRQIHVEDLIYGSPEDLILSPVVIAMWEPMARVLGWPEKTIGWQDIANLAASDSGWEAYDFPEWGAFKFGHTHPDYSDTGILSIIAEAYAGTGKQKDLFSEDVDNEDVLDFMRALESSIVHYGPSTGDITKTMFESGLSYLSAAVMYESSVVQQESARLSGASSQIPVVSIYPKEGTFWGNNPYIILNSSWVGDEEKEAAGLFLEFLLDSEQQESAMAYGFRPVNPSIDLGSPLDGNHGVNLDQPQTTFAIPSGDVIESIIEAWREIKKPVDLVVVMDVSGSMVGEKISSARSSLMTFSTLLDDQDRFEVITFCHEIKIISDLSPIGEKRESVQTRISGIVENGDTKLYDAIMFAYEELESKGNEDHIRAVVILSDGADSHSELDLNGLLDNLNDRFVKGNGDAIKVFTIAFGVNADEHVLELISDTTGGKQYKGNPSTIDDIYRDIATFL